MSNRGKLPDIDARLAIAACGTVAEAAIVRTMLASHGIVATVSGENHAAAMGGMAGAWSSLQVQVAVSDAQEARRLIDEMRASNGAPDPEFDNEAVAAGVHADSDLQREAEAIAQTSQGDFIGQKLHSRRIALSALASLMVTFGMGHGVAGAWLRMMLLAGVEIMGIRYLAAGETTVGAALVIGAILFDLIDSQRILRANPVAAQLPAATLRG